MTSIVLDLPKGISGHIVLEVAAPEYKFLKIFKRLFSKFDRTRLVKCNADLIFLLKMSGFESSDRAYNLWLKLFFLALLS